jgi:hypothetical protein
MVGPEHLRAVRELEGLEGLFPRVRRSEGGVAAGVPVLREDHVLEARGEAVGDGHHLVAFGHGERAARDEVVLHVDHHQAGVALHFFSPTISTSARSAAV